MKRFESNQQLYDYLVSLSSALKTRGFENLSGALVFASKQASTTSTEFLGESRIVLRRVFEEEAALTKAERAEVSDALNQLDEALDGRL